LFRVKSVMTGPCRVRGKLFTIEGTPLQHEWVFPRRSLCFFSKITTVPISSKDLCARHKTPAGRLRRVYPADSSPNLSLCARTSCLPCMWSRLSTGRRCAALCSTTSSPTQRCKRPLPLPSLAGAPRASRARSPHALYPYAVPCGSTAPHGPVCFGGDCRGRADYSQEMTPGRNPSGGRL
jgi:hypothetical protein